MLPGPPLGGAPGSIAPARSSWTAHTIGKNTMVGYVNIRIDAPIPADWEALDAGAGDPVTLPPEAIAVVDPPADVFYTDPDVAPPEILIFKFKLHRIQPTTPPNRHR
jgi:hypothetical protein